MPSMQVNPFVLLALLGGAPAEADAPAEPPLDPEELERLRAEAVARAAQWEADRPAREAARIERDRLSREAEARWEAGRPAREAQAKALAEAREAHAKALAESRQWERAEKKAAERKSNAAEKIARRAKQVELRRKRKGRA